VSFPIQLFYHVVVSIFLLCQLEIYMMSSSDKKFIGFFALVFIDLFCLSGPSRLVGCH
jgi:hypothetical protein